MFTRSHAAVRLFIVGCLAVGVAFSTGTDFYAQDENEDAEAIFTVRIINVSRGNTIMTSEGTQTATPLSPGVWAVHTLSAPIFAAGEPDRGDGLEAIAEDGMPGPLASALRTRTGVESSGAFTTQFGLDMPGPIGPGQAYIFEFTAHEGEHLSLATMFVQSNDLLYAPSQEGIALFTESGRPINGDITHYFELWDAGTEVNEEPGIGPNQAPRQSGPNTGPDENGVVQLVDDDYEYPDVRDVIRVIINPN